MELNLLKSLDSNQTFKIIFIVLEVLYYQKTASINISEIAGKMKTIDSFVQFQTLKLLNSVPLLSIHNFPLKKN